MLHVAYVDALCEARQLGGTRNDIMCRRNMMVKVW